MLRGAHGWIVLVVLLAGTPVMSQMSGARTGMDRKDPRFDTLVPKGAALEQLAAGFAWSEGPVWDRKTGALLFSDIPNNVINRWTPADGITVFLKPAGYTGSEPFTGREPGSNGLTFDAQGHLVLCQHGDRRISRLNADRTFTTLVDRYEGKRLNSPNDLVYRSDGTLFFTDPPFGLPDPAESELGFSGVYRVAEGRTELVTDELEGPNGIAFSPDERHLYVGNWQDDRKVVWRHDLETGAGEVFFDMTDASGEDAIDGIKVDRAGHLYVCGPGGVWVLSPDGDHLGTLAFPEAPHNLAWGDDDGRTLYVTALTGVYRLRVAVPGIRPE